MAETLQVVDTGFYADSVEWCPHSSYHDILLCGTYQLQEDPQEQDTANGRTKPQTRHGNVQVYRITEDHGPPMEDRRSLSLKKTVVQEMPGVLDIKWSPDLVNGSPVFGLVNSVGKAELHMLNDLQNAEVRVTKLMGVSLGENVLGLSLDWSNRINKSMTPQLTTSSSDGCIQVHQLTSGELTPLSSWKAHDYEAWITAFDYWDTNVVYTGGDDCRLKGWDLRQNSTSPIFSSRRHEMGVCSIQSCPIQDHLLCTGSYDEHLLVWDSRQMRQPLADQRLGGGIWRVKWHPLHATLILTATMYNGYHVVDVEQVTDGNMAVIHHYDKDVSLGYGADWCYSDSHNNLIATCSFYNHALQFWKFTRKNQDVG